MPKKKLKAALYVRVSTEFQKDKDSIPMQIKDLENYAKALGIESFVLFNDAGYSAKNTNRPEFQRMMERCRKKEFSHLLIWKLDRISRNLGDFVNICTELDQYDVALVSKNEQFDTSSVMGKAVMKIIMVFAELEREMTVMRVKAVMQSRANEGIWNGGPPPWGYMRQYDSDGKVIEGVFPIPNPAEVPIIRTIFETYAKTKSLHKAGKILDAMGIKSREGLPLSVPHIARVINKQFYIGNYEYNKRNGYKSGNAKTKPKEEWILCEGTHEAIIPKELWEECQRIKNGNRNFNRKTGQLSDLQERHIFAGYCFCGRCGCSTAANILPSRKHPHAPFLASRYNCMKRYSTLSDCKSNGSASELKLVPSMLKLITRLLEASKNAARFADDKALTDFLLEGIFDGATGIEESMELFRVIRARVKEHNYPVSDSGPYISNSLLIAEAKQSIAKQERLLVRLQKLFLLEEGEMSDEEYKRRKAEITNRIASLNQQINDLTDDDPVDDEQFLVKAGELILLNKLKSNKDDFEYYSTVKLVPKKVLRAFMKSIVSRIEVIGTKVTKVVFQNGLTCTLKYE